MAELLDSDPSHPSEGPWLKKVMKTSSNSHNSRVGRSAPPGTGLVFQRVGTDRVKKGHI